MNRASLAGAVTGWKGYALALAIGIAAGGLAAAWAQAGRYEAEIATLKKDRAEEQAQQARTALAEIVRLGNIIAGIDADYYEELQHAVADNGKLRADLASGALRLRANVRAFLPDAASAAGMGDGAGTAELDEATARSLAAIAGDGDRAIIKLTACQAYAAAVSSAGGK